MGLVFAITLATILGAWGFQFAGYPPCELCLAQRYAYYAAVPLSLLFLLIGRDNPRMMRIGLILLGLIMLGSCIFGIFHAGVEWKFWQGPTACTGGGELTGLPDLTKKAVMCDQPAIRILGLSLAGWNAVVSAITSYIAFSRAR
ncbi:disulfide bond formation protein B [Aestuariivirga litoralis]|nr:disulfide bond formation protein B [Aestuariivirga litoralis]